MALKSSIFGSQMPLPIHVLKAHHLLHQSEPQQNVQVPHVIIVMEGDFKDLKIRPVALAILFMALHSINLMLLYLYFLSIYLFCTSSVGASMNES